MRNLTAIFNKLLFIITDVTMEAGRARSLCHVGSLIRSRSEGTLIEPDDDTRKKSNGELLVLELYPSVSSKRNP